MLKKKKKDYLKLLIQRIEKGRWVLERWAFMLYSKVKVYLSKGYDLLVLIMSRSPTLKNRLWQQLKDLAQNVGKLLMYTAAIIVTLISWLLLLMPVALLYVAVLPLVLNHIVLILIRTKLYQARTKLETSTWTKFLRKKD